MLNKYAVMIPFACLMFSTSVIAQLADAQICNSPYYECVVQEDGRIFAYPKFQKKQHSTRVQKVTNSESLENTTYAQASSKVPTKIAGRNIIKVDLGNLTWAAYDGEGQLVRTGRASGGKSYCPDLGRACRTVTGTYTIYTKRGAGCFSTRFPIGKGGAPMPYCMFFHGGYALHGSNDVPNHNASHGCVRLVPEDARWLNQNFVKVGSTRVSIHY